MEASGGVVGLMAGRERGEDGASARLQRRLAVTRPLLERLGLEAELQGHEGCVNCLEWNSDGSVLASASDDLHVILWDPFRHRMLRHMVTGHTGNIFSIKWLGRGTVATGAADCSVRVREVAGGGEAQRVCSCHCGRVKRLATAPDSPHLLWSAAEDGLVLQHDLRVPHSCNSDAPCVLVSLLNHAGRYAEAKCVAVNPRRPEQLAVGANDLYVRLYDRRMIKLSRLATGSVPAAGAGSGGGEARGAWERQSARAALAGGGDPDNNIPRAAATYFAPGHLSTEPDQVFPKKATTYVAFSPDGTELLVNLGSEQVYLFDVNTARRPLLLESYIIEHNHGNRPPSNGYHAVPGAASPPPTPPAADYKLPAHVAAIKETANELVRKKQFAEAVELYNTAIGRCADCAVLHSNRAAALMRRNWAGDMYAGVRDCYAAIALDPRHVKSHFRLAKALLELRRPREAHECLLYFKDKFPKHAASHAVFLLQKDVERALAAMTAPADDESEEGTVSTSALERQLRAAALDYSQRFLGHCNTTTDIKEANFLGPDAAYVAAGSDDGSMFIWCRRTGNIVRCLRGDDSIVNCIQCHPSTFLLATSGIETTVRLWSPRPEDGRPEPRLVSELSHVTAANQVRMRSDPFEAMLFNISFAGGGGGGAGAGSGERREQPPRDLHSPPCRAS